MKRTILALLALVAISATVHAQTSVTGSGGTLTAPTTVGQLITVTSVHLSNGQIATLNCPVTAFGSSTYQWNWRCENGILSLNGVATATVEGTMTLTCSGGGRTHVTTCWHNFSGTAWDADSYLGSVTISAKGGPNNAPGTVTAFSASW